MLSDIFRLLQHLDSLLAPLGIRYVVGGSLASSVHGEVRATNDIDVLVEVSEERIRATRHDILQLLVENSSPVQDSATPRPALADSTSDPTLGRCQPAA